jgi:hypothetical protein
MESLTLTPEGSLLSYSPLEMLINALLATAIGFWLAFIYRQNHKGLSYSQSFTQTIIFIALIVAIVIMVIGGNLARAFALVGAMSIIRFRTVLKDTKDLAYVFGALALGMAAGTSNYVLAGIGTILITVLSFVLNMTNFGSVYKSEFILRFRLNESGDSEGYLAAMNKACRRSKLLHVEPSGDGQSLMQTFDIAMRDEIDHTSLVKAMNDVSGVSEVVLIASKNDVDY